MPTWLLHSQRYHRIENFFIPLFSFLLSPSACFLLARSCSLSLSRSCVSAFIVLFGCWNSYVPLRSHSVWCVHVGNSHIAQKMMLQNIETVVALIHSHTHLENLLNMLFTHTSCRYARTYTRSHSPPIRMHLIFTKWLWKVFWCWPK